MIKTLRTPTRLVASIALTCGSAMLLSATAVPAPGVSVQFNNPPSPGNEHQGPAALTLPRSGDLPGTTRVYWFTEQPDPQNDAIPDIDFAQTNTHSPASVTFAPGASQAQISVPVTDHAMPGPMKQFSVKIFAKGVVGAGDIAAVRIIGNDPMLAVKDPSEPLALVIAAPGYKGMRPAKPASATITDPLAKVRFYVAPMVPLTTVYS